MSLRQIVIWVIAAMIFGLVAGYAKADGGGGGDGGGAGGPRAVCEEDRLYCIIIFSKTAVTDTGMDAGDSDDVAGGDSGAGTGDAAAAGGDAGTGTGDPGESGDDEVVHAPTTN